MEFEQEYLTQAVSCKDSITWDYATRKVRQVVESRSFSCNNHVCPQSVLCVHICLTFYRSNHWYSDTGEIL
jgi:hypothetical protein